MCVSLLLLFSLLDLAFSLGFSLPQYEAAMKAAADMEAAAGGGRTAAAADESTAAQMMKLRLRTIADSVGPALLARYGKLQ